MKKSLVKSLVFIFVLLLAVASMSACDETLPLRNKSVSELSDLDFYPSEGLLDDAVFTLTDDIVSDDFTPLNTDKNYPARGVLDGNEKKISLTVKEKDDLSIIAFFGYAEDFTVKNLTLEFNVADSVKLATEKTVIASLIGYAVDNVTIDNVTVKFSASPSMTLREYYVDDEPDPRYSSDNVQYVGGLIGVSGGKVSVVDTSVSMRVDASDYRLDELTGREMYRKELYAGGILAISDSSSETIVTSSSVTEFFAEVNADKVSVGGIASVASGCSLSESSVESYDFSLGFSDRIDVGGVVGSAYNATINSVDAYGVVSSLKALGGSSKRTVVNLGGIAGYFYGDFSPVYDNVATISSCESSLIASGSGIYSSAARFSYGAGVLKNTSFKGNTLLGTLTDVVKDDYGFSSAVGNFFGEAIGSATVDSDNVATVTVSYDAPLVTEHLQVDDDGVITPTRPRV